MTREELQERALEFSLAVYTLVKPMFRDADKRLVAEQLFGSSSSTASNYRAACVARSDREWVAKLGIVREEADESVHWLIFIQRAGLADNRRSVVDTLLNEAQQLTRIFAAAYNTSRKKLDK
jgi:four helix bundle protein